MDFNTWMKEIFDVPYTFEVNIAQNYAWAEA